MRKTQQPLTFRDLQCFSVFAEKGILKSGLTSDRLLVMYRNASFLHVHAVRTARAPQNTDKTFSYCSRESLVTCTIQADSGSSASVRNRVIVCNPFKDGVLD